MFHIVVCGERTKGIQVLSSYSVLNVLYSLIQKSKINEHIVAQQEGKSTAEIACVSALVFLMLNPLRRPQ